MTPRPDSLDALRARFGDRYKWMMILTVMVGMVGRIVACHDGAGG